MYALNIDKDTNRILSACDILPGICYESMQTVDLLPDGDLYDYLYVNGEYVYDPLPEPEADTTPTQMDILEAQVTYTAMMTDTLLEV